MRTEPFLDLFAPPPQMLKFYTFWGGRWVYWRARPHQGYG